MEKKNIDKAQKKTGKRPELDGIPWRLFGRMDPLKGFCGNPACKRGNEGNIHKGNSKKS